MRLIVSSLLLGALFLTGCANQGVIVQKESRPHPFYESVGIEGVYTFLLRDDAGAVHRQMVTPEVYERYAIGDHFNDEAPARATNDVSEPKAVQVAMHQPTFALGQVVQTTKAATTRRVAVAKSQSPSKSKFAHSSKHNASTKIATHRSQKRNSHARLARHSRSHGKTVASHTRKKTKTLATANRTPKPWKITAPAEGPTAPVEKPALRETQVEIADSPER